MTAYLWAMFAFLGFSLALDLLAMREDDANAIDGVCTLRDAALLAWTTYLLAQP